MENACERSREMVEFLSGSNALALALSDGSCTVYIVAQNPHILKYHSKKVKKRIVNSSCKLQLRKSAMHIQNENIYIERDRDRD